MRVWRKGWDSNPRDELPRLPVFKTGALNHSATLPRLQNQDLTDISSAHILATCGTEPLLSLLHLFRLFGCGSIILPILSR